MSRKSKLSNKVIHWQNFGIWPGSVMFCCGFNYDEIHKYLKKIKATDWLAAIENERELIDSGADFALKRQIENTKTGEKVPLFFIILKKQFDFSDYRMAVLSHEILHICQFLLQDILDINREYEALAYTHSYLMEHLLKVLRK